MIDIKGIFEATIHVAIELQFRGLQSIENTSTEILEEYFSEFSVASKAYRMQGGENVIFQEIAKVQLEYGIGHP